MRRRARFAAALAAIVALAGVAASAAWALSFNDGTPCPDTHPVFVCPEGVVGTPYSIQLIPEGGNGPPYTFILKTGSLPQGMSLGSNSGVISGTPTTAGSASFGLELQDKPADPGCPGCGCAARTPPTCAYRDFTMNVLAGLSIETKSLDDKPGSIGVPYSAPLNATLLTAVTPPTGTPATGATWSIVSGTLPPGLNIVNGVITGTPTTAGSFTFVVQAELDSKRKDTETLRIDVTAALVVTAPAKPRSEVGVPFIAKLVGAGGTGVYSWSVVGGALPPGIALAADGTLVGKPTTAGTFSFTAALADSAGRTVTQAITIPVASRLAVFTQRLRVGKAGRLYRAKLVATGGVLPKTWKVAQGPLPRGIRLDRALGVLSGTPTRPGRYRVTFEVTDTLKVKAVKALVIEVLP